MIEARGVSHCYGRERALDNVSLRIETDEFVGITGESGSGKSTLLSILSTLLRPTRGEVLLDGVDITTLDDVDRLRRNDIGFVFQFHFLISYLTVRDNLRIAATRANQERIDEVLESLEISKIGGKFPDEISGGERQRAAIARAMINAPKVLFADEPTGNLDSRNSRNVYEVFRALRSQGSTLVVATHDQKIGEFADRCIEVEDGRVLDLRS